MKKFLGLILGFGLVYFVSLGCINKNPKPPKVISNKIVALYPYADEKSLLMLGDLYFYLINGEHDKNDPKQAKENSETISHIIGKQGVYVKVYKDIVGGSIHRKYVDFSLDITINPEEIEPALLSWVKSRTREVKYDGAMKTEPIFHLDRQNRYNGNLWLSGLVYTADQEILERAIKLGESWTIKVSDFGMTPPASLPQQRRPNSDQNYILDARLLKQAY